MQTYLTTWRDLIDHLTDWIGASPTAEVQRDARRASLSAYRDMASAHRWTYYYTRGRIATNAPYQTGTVVYDHSGGAYERLLTLTGGTWPSWSRDGTVVIDQMLYDVAERIDGTRITLSVNANPGDDLSSTTYLIYRDTYPLPADALAIDQMIIQARTMLVCYEHPSSWLERQRIFRGQATPATYTIRGEPNYMGSLAISFYPPPDQAYNMDFIYQRRPRDLVVDEYKTGTASTVNGSVIVTGNGTSWESKHAGCVLRLSADSVSYPTGRAGANPAVYERVVTSVDSSTALTVDQSIPANLSGVKYNLSDPVDIEEGAMLTALLRCCEYQMSQTRNRSERDNAQVQYARALLLAREADSRNASESYAGQRTRYPYRLADFPSGPDV